MVIFEMKTLVCAAAIVFVSLHQSVSASSIDFQASESIIYPVITKTLTLRCAVRQDTDSDVANRTGIEQPEVQPAMSASSEEKPVLQPREATTHNAPRLIISASTPHPASGFTTHPTHQFSTHLPFSNTTHPSTIIAGSTSTHTQSTRTPSIAPGTGFSRYTTPGHPQTTPGHQNVTHGNVSYIESIIISRIDKATGQMQSIAWVLPYNTPTTSIDPDNIKVNGAIESQDAPQQGYLDISWEYPTESQSGTYFCDIYALDSSLSPVALKSSVYIRASEATVTQLAGLVAQLAGHVDQYEKQIAQLQQSLSNATNQISNLKEENQRQIEDLNNTTSTLLNKTNDIKSQNIQIGNTFCTNTYVTFPKSYSETPTVFLSVDEIQKPNQYVPFSFSVTVEDLSSTGFFPYCILSQISSINITWIAVDN